MSHISTEEKIDFIYNELKKEKSHRTTRVVVKILFYMGIIAYGLYFYFIWFDKLVENLVEKVTPNLDGVSKQELIQKAKDILPDLDF